MRWRSRLNRELKPLFSFRTYLNDLTTLGVGGPAECLARPLTQRDMEILLAFCREEGTPFWLLGGGSNVLVPDEGLPGITILTSGLNGVFWEETGDAVTVYSESGTLLASLLGLSLRRGWTGLEFAAGIPGTLGGALAGNAGAEGLSLGDLVRSVKVIQDDGNVRDRSRGEIDFSYRFSSLGLEGVAITGCRLVLKKSNPSEIAEKVRGFLSNRKGQPRGVKTAGCIFKNPEGSSAGKLLDEAGCKGLECGNAVVSMKHANFIENRGSASTKDILSLIDRCRTRVVQNSGVYLATEIRFLGNSLNAKIPN
ncbi:UDP-N-acetylmuramate dehydrogenase [Candidatus Oleimmundimicrobium sp.]|uniref:UDP-N-acetylmuramate dehydrogenase n=1 Tax=Candidatus Oleimmundimicrobium sp. TaxID=3060597 RepID=UPI002715F891|nr:UDP-N-acetylmuramate dehydrogenase [Candidatus Oleimmundimicrobium sp.]MDO8885529.1 UDP-N-acetylmuramate dehydrogenase [Candidatus Oleimmundimicrobium sp.]MDO9508575.1 UDP-N-acetylmuramate dehydrogenase [Thermovirgaceae bacterium]